MRVGVPATGARERASSARPRGDSCASSNRARTRARALKPADAAARALDFNAVARSHVAGYGSAPVASRLTREFGFGDAGSDVACVQRLLGLAGDGRCDGATSDALRAWQSSRGLTPSGFFGRASMAQLAREEEAWRELGGDAVLARLAAEREAATRAESGTSARHASVAAKPSAPVWSSVHSAASHSSVLIAIVGLAGAAAWRARSNVDVAAWATSRRADVDAALARAAAFVASAAFIGDVFERFRLAIVGGLTAIATMAKRATTPLAESVPTVENVELETPVIEESERAASRPTVTFVTTARGPSSSRRAEEMRERWVNVRRGPVDAAGSDIRREDADGIKRVSDFLGGEGDAQT